MKNGEYFWEKVSKTDNLSLHVLEIKEQKDELICGSTFALKLE